MLKTAKNFECKEVLGDYMIIPKGDAMRDFSGTIVLSESSAAAWKHLEQGCSMEELVDFMYEEFDAPREEISSDMEALIKRLGEYGVLEEQNS